MARANLAAEVVACVRPTVEALGFDLVRVQLIGQQRPRLQVMVERRDGRLMQVDDCAEVSRAISAVLDVEDPIAGSYTLEVSSPGIDRPLVRLVDFDRFAGFEAKVETDRAIAGQRRFTGRLLGIAGEQVRLDVAGREVMLPFADILRAKLILNDELTAATAERATKQPDNQ